MENHTTISINWFAQLELIFFILFHTESQFIISDKHNFKWNWNKQKRICEKGKNQFFNNFNQIKLQFFIPFGKWWMDGKINQFSFVPYKLVTVTCELMNSLYHWKKLCYLFKIKLNKKLRNFSRFYWTFLNQHIPLSLIRTTNISLFSNKNKKNLKKAYYICT